MPSSALVVKSATVKWSTQSSGYVAIPEVTEFVIPQGQQEDVDVTSLDSGGARERKPGLIDYGTIQIPCFYRGTAYASAATWNTSGTLIYFEATMDPLSTQTVSGDKFTWAGYVRPQLNNGQVGAAYTAFIEVKNSGAVTRTAGT